MTTPMSRARLLRRGGLIAVAYAFAVSKLGITLTVLGRRSDDIGARERCFRASSSGR